MKLLVQYIQDAPRILNTNKELTLLLRDKHITEIDNLQTTNDIFHCIDLTNNNLVKLSNIPQLKNLKTLLLGNNNITYIDIRTLSETNIESLSLYNNNLYKFQFEIRTVFKNLRNLVLIDNPITRIENYRLFTIWIFPNLKVLDFTKVKESERVKAREIFGDDNSKLNEKGEEIIKLENVVSEASKDDKQLNNIVKKLTDKEKQGLLKKLESATSLDEIEEIESTLQKGIV
ncbi:unnamed protein product [Candida verbasci]|uniref:U2 small nuclear ribonucleoprotein A' n=1 Tax=Candida verbasci TaxID=1227364 RepID=A0A9W4XB81_9ASCO|nr:unnamed protein product [Candida verbasci]